MHTGHDEDEDKTKIGTPLERVLLMANAMLDAIKTFKSPDGKNLRIRIGELLEWQSILQTWLLFFMSD